MILSCKNVTLGYDGRAVVSGVDFTVEAGDRLCVVGENGSGKSTLVKGMLGLLKPMSGMFEYAGRCRAGYMPQHTAARRDFPASVREVVMSGLAGGLRPFYTKSDREKAAACMDMAEISERARVSYRDLSGGQKRRVLLARALCAASGQDGDALLFLDEPEAGLDPGMTASMYELLLKLNAERGVTLVMITHDIGGALEFGTKILHLSDGGIFFGTPSQFGESGHGGRRHA